VSAGHGSRPGISSRHGSAVGSGVWRSAGDPGLALVASRVAEPVCQPGLEFGQPVLVFAASVFVMPVTTGSRGAPYHDTSSLHYIT
jgi:hypothetical protein